MRNQSAYVIGIFNTGLLIKPSLSDTEAALTCWLGTLTPKDPYLWVLVYRVVLVCPSLCFVFSVKVYEIDHWLLSSRFLNGVMFALCLLFLLIIIFLEMLCHWYRDMCVLIRLERPVDKTSAFYSNLLVGRHVHVCMTDWQIAENANDLHAPTYRYS
jgi:hypothetical protein